MESEASGLFYQKLGQYTFYALFLLAIWLVYRQSKKKKDTVKEE